MTERIIVPLDGINEEAALELAAELKNHVWGFKVNDLLLNCGLSIITKLKQYGKVFADPKLHDIPNTVQNSVSRLVDAGADIITVHCSGGISMLKAATEAAKDSTILGVTVLTSIGDEDCQKIYQCSPAQAVKRLALLAFESGLPGIVCSSQELELLNDTKETKALLKVIPGIRPSWHFADDDQTRIMTPKRAIEYGADLLVIGRPITLAKKPLDAVKRINDEIS